MPFTMIRIDDRYIHGQVATTWMMAIPTKKCFVINDQAATEQMTRMVLEMVATTRNIGLEILKVEEGIKRLTEVQNDPDSMWALFGNPQDVLKAIQEGFKIDKLIVGFMRFSGDKKPVKSGGQVYVDDADISAFKAISAEGVKVVVQRVPSESAADMMKLLNKK